MTVLASTVLTMPLSDINAQPKLFPRDLLEHLGQPPIGFQFDLHVLYHAPAGAADSDDTRVVRRTGARRVEVGFQLRLATADDLDDREIHLRAAFGSRR